ncbi:MAG: methyltransferase [Oscillospiraceae bacterium]|jgi:tRNA1(Val) A37 N6-methylase TrmN6|nr:methyltransferase [Oscillospiraceae bacterium]
MCEIEELFGGFKIYISKDHKFGTDAFLLADFAAQRAGGSVLDLCAGCGIVGFLLGLIAAPRRVCAVEIQKEATELMKLTVAANQLFNFEVMLADLKELNVAKVKGGVFDLVTCNPPYKAKRAGILNKSENLSISRHEIMCDINDICRVASCFLKVGGRLCLCQRSERLVDTLEAMRTNGVEPKRIRFVSSRQCRAPWLFLVDGRKDGKPFLKIEAPLFLEDEGGPTPELLRIYRKEAKI